METENAPINEKTAAKILGVSVATLRKWRSTGRGPGFLKFGYVRSSAVRYLPSEILAWRDSHYRKPSAE